jgi:hypothetical protein
MSQMFPIADRFQYLVEFQELNMQFAIKVSILLLSLQLVVGQGAQEDCYGDEDEAKQKAHAAKYGANHDLNNKRSTRSTTKQTEFTVPEVSKKASCVPYDRYIVSFVILSKSLKLLTTELPGTFELGIRKRHYASARRSKLHDELRSHRPAQRFVRANDCLLLEKKEPFVVEDFRGSQVS